MLPPFQGSDERSSRCFHVLAGHPQHQISAQQQFRGQPRAAIAAKTKAAAAEHLDDAGVGPLPSGTEASEMYSHIRRQTG